MRKQKNNVKFKIVFYGVLALSIIVTFNSIRTILSAYEKGERIQEAKQELQNAKEKNTKLRKEIEKKTTKEYVLKEARKQLNYGMEGEEIIIIPEDIKEPVTEQKNNTKGATIQKQKTKTYKKWLDLFL